MNGHVIREFQQSQSVVKQCGGAYSLELTLAHKFQVDGRAKVFLTPAPRTEREYRTRRKVFFVAHLPSQNRAPAGFNAIMSPAKFSQEIGFEAYVMNSVIRYHLILPWLLRSAEVFLATYPNICSPTLTNPLRTFDRHLIRIARRTRSKRGTILYVYDLPIEQAANAGRERMIDKETYRTERDIFRSFDVLCVYNYRAKQLISQRYGIPLENFVEFEILDHATTFIPPACLKKPSESWKIAWVGDSGRWVNELPRAQEVRYLLIGRNWNWVEGLHRPDFFNAGFIIGTPLLQYLSSNAHFGIIYPYSKGRERYYDYVSGSNIGTYSVAGLPILVSSKCGEVPSLSSKYGIGLTFDKLDDIPSLVKQVSHSDYEKMRIRSLEFGEKVRSGYFFKRAMSLAMNRLGVT